MAVNQLKLAKELEKNNGTKNIEKAIKKSAPKKIEKKENWAQTLKRKVKEILYAEKTYLPNRGKSILPVEKKIKPTKKTPKTMRTEQVESKLKRAGITYEEIAKLRGKK